MNETITVFLAAVIPAVVLVIYIYAKDDRPEPVGQLVKAFLLGALSAPLSLLVSKPLAILGYYSNDAVGLIESFRIAFFGAALPEELAKMFVLWLFLRRNRHFDEYFDGLVYAACVGMGFAALENVMYLFDGGEDWQLVGRMRALMAVPGHFLFAMLMGYYYSLAHFSNNAVARSRYYTLSLVAPIVAHCAYDTLAFMSDGYFGILFFAGVVVLLIKLWRRFARNMKELKEHDHYRFDVTPPPLNVTPPPLPRSPKQEPKPDTDNSRYMPKDDQ